MDDSPFSCHFHTNFTPSDHESEDIKRFLLEPLAELSNIEQDISRAQLMLDRLIQERDSLKQVVDAHRALLSPVRRLPHDVLEEIFFHCLPSDRNPVMSSKEAPLLLGRICSAWRTIFLSMPRLWDSIHIHIPPYARNEGFGGMPPQSDLFPPYEKAATISALRSSGLQQWLDRSGSRPLRISLYSEGASTQIYPAVLQILVSFSHRWRELIFQGPIPNFTSVKVLTEDDLPLLRSLHIHNTAYEEWTPAALLCPNRLRRVSLTSMSHNYRAYPFDWSQLTELNLRSPRFENFSDTLSVSDALHVLTMSPRLVKCFLAVQHSTEEGIDRPSQKPLVVLPFLEELGIFSPINLRDFFKSLHLPVIRELEYQIQQVFPFFENEAPDRKFKESLLTLLTRCGGTLRSLDFTPGQFTSLEIQECLVETPFLTRLIFNQYFDPDMALQHSAWVHPQSSSPPALDDIFISWLTPTPENTDVCLLPYLEEFQCKVFSSFSDKALSAFIRGRRSGYEGIAWLRRVHAILAHIHREDGIIHICPPYAEEGLEGEIIYARRPARTKYSASKGIPFCPQETAYLAPIYSLI